MDKKYLHHVWTRIRPVKAWYFLAAGLVLGAISVVGLRQNYVGMTRLRSDVFLADKNNGDVEGSLQKLRAYVGGHMNTNLESDNGVYPPIQLKYTYERLTAAEQKRVDDNNSKVYTDAQHHCEELYPSSFSGGPRVPCIEQYVKDHGTTAKKIPDALYKFSFVTPRWSPDLAGWSMVLAALCFLLAALRIVAGLLLKRFTHK